MCQTKKFNKNNCKFVIGTKFVRIVHASNDYSQILEDNKLTQIDNFLYVLINISKVAVTSVYFKMLKCQNVS